MGTHTILAEETVSVSELRKNPGKYITDHPVAVMSHNRATGYLLNAELFESMVAIVEQNMAAREVVGEFRPAAARLKAIAEEGARLLAEASDDELRSFSE